MRRLLVTRRACSPPTVAAGGSGTHVAVTEPGARRAPPGGAVNLLAAAFDWTDPASIGYPRCSARACCWARSCPVVPTGAVVGAAAAIATTTGRLWLPR